MDTLPRVCVAMVPYRWATAAMLQESDYNNNIL